MLPFESYVACVRRDLEIAERFLDHFLPSRVEVALDYPFPFLVDEPVVTFSDTGSLIERLLRDGEEDYSIYWDRVGAGEPRLAMLFFTKDRGMIAGLVAHSVDSMELLRELAGIVKGRFGLVTDEQIPPDTLEEFIQRCRVWTGPRLIDGR